MGGFYIFKTWKRNRRRKTAGAGEEPAGKNRSSRSWQGQPILILGEQGFCPHGVGHKETQSLGASWAPHRAPSNSCYSNGQTPSWGLVTPPPEHWNKCGCWVRVRGSRWTQRGRQSFTWGSRALQQWGLKFIPLIIFLKKRPLQSLGSCSPNS